MGKPNRYVDFVQDSHFLACVKHVCEGYPPSNGNAETTGMWRNNMDPFKIIFDILNSGNNVNEWINGERIRQNDKTLNNRIGEFHQMLLGGVSGWVNLETGDASGLDLKKSDGLIFIELKNKFNTVNDDSSNKVREKLEAIVREYPKATAYFAYILDKNGKSYDIAWNCKGHVLDERIRKISGKKVYELITGDYNALESVWKALPLAIGDALGTKVRIKDMDKAKLEDFFKASLK